MCEKSYLLKFLRKTNSRTNSSSTRSI